MINKDLGNVKGSPQRLSMLLGMRTKHQMAIIPSEIDSKNRNIYSMEKYKFLLEANFPISDSCCKIMKKNPAHEYSRKTGRKFITAEMADESRLRTQKWMQNGCNGFNLKNPKSTPMAFWTEQDVLHYIKKYDVPISSVYGDIVYTDDDGMEYCEPIFVDSMKLKTTGCKRTGCMFCLYGAHLERSPGRLELMKETHPKQYDYIMRPTEQGGLNYKEVIDWLNENGNLNIKY